MEAAPALAPLAAWCASDHTARLASDAAEHVAHATLDWLGALASGRADPGCDAYCEASALLGAPNLAGQAFLLGALSHITEVDDGHRAAMLHPGIVTFPPLVALAAAREIDVGTWRRAVLAGYEVSVRVGRALGPGHYRHFHSTATAGSFGAAAAASVALGLDAGGTLAALGHAGTQAAGVWQFADDGAEAAKPAHPGFAARNGLTAAALARAGLPGATRIFEGPRGLSAAWNAPIDPAALTSPTTVEETALATRTVKAWPVCGQMHHVLDAVSAMLREIDATDDIAGVEIASFASLEWIAGLADPKTVGQARFSTPWCVARLIRRGALGFDTFRNPQVLADEAVADLARNVRLKTDAGFDATFPDRREARVTLRMRDGTRRERHQVGRRGDPDRPFDWSEMIARHDRITAGSDAGDRRAAIAFADRLRTADGDERIDGRQLRSLCHVA